MPSSSSPVTVRIDDTVLRLRVGRGVHPLGPGTLEMAKHLEFRSGESVLDLGCGHGLFAMLAAKRGASRVVGTDIDPAAVACARENARLNQVPNAEFRSGNLLEPVRGERFDAIVTNPPQTPAPGNFLPDKWGGPDGTLYVLPVLRQAPEYLKPGGRIYLMLLSLSNPDRALEVFREHFDVREVGWMKRHFTPEEYDGYQPGLFQYLQGLKEQGVARFEPDGRRWFFITYFLQGTLKA